MDLATARVPAPDAPAAAHPSDLRRRWLTCAALCAAFAVLTLSVDRGWSDGVDGAVMRWTAAHRSAPLTSVAAVLVALATPLVLISATAVVVAWRAWTRRSWRALVLPWVRLGLLTVSVLALKHATSRPGPPLHEAFQRVPIQEFRGVAEQSGGAFPSGHTTTTIVCVALLIAALGGRAGRWRAVVLLGSVALVSLALVYMDYHWLTDVIGGWLLGAVLLLVPLVRRGRRVGR